MTKYLRVLLAEDDADMRSAMAATLRACGVEVVEVPDGADVRSYMDDCVLLDAPKPRVHALVTDISMPGMSGDRLIEYLEGLGHSLPTVVVTGLQSDIVDRLARHPAVYAVLHKPFDPDELLRSLGQAVESDPMSEDA